MRTPQEIAQAFDPASRLDSVPRLFLVGIGGAGMSALARMARRRGIAVVGTDGASSDETKRLLDEDFDVRIGHSGEGIRPGDGVVLSDAIDLKSSPEVAAARAHGCPLFRRSQLLGWLVRDRRVLAVTGTHGKTTTTGLVGSGLRGAGLDPLIVVGASIPEWAGPVVEGDGEWAAVEACEAYNGFHDLQPDIVVLTNLELDHVDFHGSYENLRTSVLSFVNRIPHEGLLVYCEDDEGARDIAARVSVPKMGYSGRLDGLTLPGAHNGLNAKGALEACLAAGADEAGAMEGIRAFRGAERRLQVVAQDPIRVVNDYAHHPTEVAASLQALREGTENRLIVVFQPHLYSRTAPLIREFAEALSHADLVVLTDIYPAREAPMPGVSAARIAELVTKPVHYVPSRHLLARTVARIAQPGDTVVGMGAGTIGSFPAEFLAERARTGTKVAVLFGGDSPEREVSLHSGRAVLEAVHRLGYPAVGIDVTEGLLSRGDLRAFIGPERPTVAFLALHGPNGEDGGMQGLMAMLHLPHTGSGIQASALAMDKAMTKRVLDAEGIRTPRGVVVRPCDPLPSLEAPLVVKPNSQGSTVGLTFVERTEDLAEAIERGLRYDSSVLVEEWVRGVEISVPVLVDRALLPVEIVPATGRYDFASKYLPGATEEICPARLSAERQAEVMELALRAHHALGCAGATRTDMIVREQDVVVLEINTLPGMTPTSLLPNSARTMGIPFDQLVDEIIQDALRRYGV